MNKSHTDGFLQRSEINYPVYPTLCPWIKNPELNFNNRLLIFQFGQNQSVIGVVIEKALTEEQTAEIMVRLCGYAG